MEVAVQVMDGRLVASASDLVGFASCAYLTHLDREAAYDRIPKPERTDPMMDLLRSRGQQHERDHLDALRAAGLEIVELDDGTSEASSATSPVRTLARRAADTVAALRRRAQVIFQATFFDDAAPVAWRGHADFVRATSQPDGDDFDIEDTKLARHVSVNAVIQLCNYAEHVGRITGRTPRRITVVLGGTASPVTFEVDRLMAYYRALKRRFLEALDGGELPYPLPVSHCRVCRWQEHCEGRWKQDDHLSRVAFITASQVKRLEAAGIKKTAQLATLDAARVVRKVAPEVLTRLTVQARLQKSSEGKAVPDFELVVPPEAGIGLAALPLPDDGDVYYDIEGHPYAGVDGLEYLHGIGTVDSGRVGNPFHFDHRWAHDPGQERRVFEEFIDFLMARWEAHPGMHVFHYAPYETTALTRLMMRYGTRETEMHALLRGQVFVDLYRVVRQGLRIGVPSYSIKKLEPLYMPERRGRIVLASSSIVEYEKWLQDPRPEILDAILTYNEDDVRSNWLLHAWLERRRDELVKVHGDVPRGTVVPPDEATRIDEDLQLLLAQLNHDRPLVV
jgi:uncharacterized protein